MPGVCTGRLRVLAADIDDTITAGGKLPAQHLDLLGKLEAAGWSWFW